MRAVYVPRKARGRGHARRLMTRIMADAAAERVPLVLRAEPYDDGPPVDVLEAWYRRLGFRKCIDWWDGIAILEWEPAT